MGKKGLNWAKSLPYYQRILNEDPKEILGYRSPFEVYFARKCNSFKTSKADDEVVANAGKCDPTERDRRRRSKHTSMVRQQARIATDRCSQRMVRAHLRSHPPSRYTIGEKVYVRLPRKGGLKTVQKRRLVIEALIVNRNLKLHTYKVSYTSRY